MLQYLGIAKVQPSELFNPNSEPQVSLTPKAEEMESLNTAVDQMIADFTPGVDLAGLRAKKNDELFEMGVRLGADVKKRDNKAALVNKVADALTAQLTPQAPEVIPGVAGAPKEITMQRLADEIIGSATDEDAAELVRSRGRGISVNDIKALLDSRGIDYSGAKLKNALIDRLVSGLRQEPSRPLLRETSLADIERMTVAQLKELAKDNNIPFLSRDKKQELKEKVIAGLGGRQAEAPRTVLIPGERATQNELMFFELFDTALREGTQMAEIHRLREGMGIPREEFDALLERLNAEGKIEFAGGMLEGRYREILENSYLDPNGVLRMFVTRTNPEEKLTGAVDEKATAGLNEIISGLSDRPESIVDLMEIMSKAGHSPEQTAKALSQAALRGDINMTLVEGIDEADSFFDPTTGKTYNAVTRGIEIIDTEKLKSQMRNRFIDC